MTPYRHMLYRYDKEPGKWEYLCDLNLTRDSYRDAPEWLRNSRKHEQLDWGTWRYQLTKEELIRLYEPPPVFGIKEEWDEPFVKDIERMRAMLADLPDDGRYAVDWEEGIGYGG